MIDSFIVRTFPLAWQKKVLTKACWDKVPLRNNFQPSPNEFFIVNWRKLVWKWSKACALMRNLRKSNGLHHCISYTWNIKMRLPFNFIVRRSICEFLWKEMESLNHFQESRQFAWFNAWSCLALDIKTYWTQTTYRRRVTHRVKTEREKRPLNEWNNQESMKISTSTFSWLWFRFPRNWRVIGAIWSRSPFSWHRFVC